MQTRVKGVPRLIVAGLVLVSPLWLGCSSSKEPKPMQQPSVQDVKSNADRSFEKLKQEEKQRGEIGAPSR